MPKFQAAEKLHEEVVRLLVELDFSLIKVKDKNGRSPSDLVSSQELFLLNLCQLQETNLYWPNLFFFHTAPGIFFKALRRRICVKIVRFFSLDHFPYSYDLHG